MALKDEFAFYLKHQNDLVAKYGGKVIAIKDQKVLGAYEDEKTAVEETVKNHALGSFIVQRCEAGTSSHTQVFHSRVIATAYVS